MLRHCSVDTCQPNILAGASRLLLAYHLSEWSTSPRHKLLTRSFRSVLTAMAVEHSNILFSVIVIGDDNFPALIASYQNEKHSLPKAEKITIRVFFDSGIMRCKTCGLPTREDSIHVHLECIVKNNAGNAYGQTVYSSTVSSLSRTGDITNENKVTIKGGNCDRRSHDGATLRSATT